MCLAIPGKVTEVFESEGVLMGKANFGGITKQICLQYTPTVSPGEYVLVHVGFALNTIDEAEAAKTYKALKDLDQLDELNIEQFVQETIKNQKSGIL